MKRFFSLATENLKKTATFLRKAIGGLFCSFIFATPSEEVVDYGSVGANNVRGTVRSFGSFKKYFPHVYDSFFKALVFFREYVYRTEYIAIVTGLALLCWAFKLEAAGLCMLAIVAGCALFATKDMLTAILPIVLFGFVNPSSGMSKEDFFNSYLVIGVICILFLLSAFIYTFKNVKWKFGNLTKGFVAMVFAFLCQGLGFDIEYYAESISLFAFPAVLAALSYLLLTNGVRKPDKLYLANIFNFVGLLLFAEVVIYYATSPDALLAIENKSIDLGWGISNNIAAMIMLTLPLTVYAFAKTRSVGYVVSVFLQYVTLLLTLSRGCIYIAAAALPVFLFIIFKTSARKKSLFVLGSLVVCAVFVVAMIFSEQFFGVIEKIASHGLDDSGRFELYENAFENFFKNPIFGTGAAYQKNVQRTSVYWYHSTPLQFLACAGFVGIGAYLIHVLGVLNLFKNDPLNVFNFIVIIAVCMWKGYALIDMNFFIPCQLFSYIVLLSFCENDATKKSVSPLVMSREIKKRKI